jgi:hypothetical protein
MFNIKKGKIMPTRKEDVAATTATKKAEPKKKVLVRSKVEKFLKTLSKEVGYDPNDKIYEAADRKVTSPSGDKFDVLFVTFSENGEKDEEVKGTDEIIKDILFAMFVATDDKPTGKVMMVEILKAEEEGEPNVAYFYEM